MTSLIDRIEAATGPDRELDRDIMFAVGYRFEERHIGAYYDGGEKALDWVFVDPSTDKWVSTHPHDFTGSLDAALTLVPEGWGYQVMPSYCVLRHPKGSYTDRSKDTQAHGSTPALALCAAALRARGVA